MAFSRKVGHRLELFFAVFHDESGGRDEVEYVGLMTKLIDTVVDEVGTGQGLPETVWKGRRAEPFPPPGLDVQPLEEIVVRRSDKGLIEGHFVVASNVVLRGVSLD